MKKLDARRGRGLPVLRGFGWIGLLILVAAAGGTGWLLTTTSGARFGVGLLVTRLPAQVTVGDVGGRLIGPLVLEGLFVRTDTFEISARRLEVEWKALALPSRRISIERLSLEGVDVRLDIDALSTESGVAATRTQSAATTDESRFEIDVQNVRVSELAVDLPRIGYVSNGTLAGSGTLGSADVVLRANVDFEAIGERSARIDLRASGWTDRAEVRIGVDVEDDTESTIPPLHADVVASGTLDDLLVSITGDSETGSTRIPPAHFEVEATGSPNAYRLDATVLAAGTDELPPIDLEFSGTGDLRSFDVEEANAEVLEGQVRFDGSVTWDPELAWVADLDVDSVAPSSLTPVPDEWPGRLSLRGETRGSMVDGALRAELSADTLGGRLREAPIEGSLEISTSNGTYDIPGVRLEWGALLLEAAGHVGDEIDVEFDLSAPDLSLPFPDATGAVRTSGTLEGDRDSPRIDATYEVDDLSFAGVSLSRGSGSMDLDIRSPDSSWVDLSARDLMVDSIPLDSVALHLRGTRQAHDLQLEAAGPGGSFDLRLVGRLQNVEVLAESSWSGRIVSLVVDVPETGALRLDEPAALVASADSVRIDPFCVSEIGSDARVCAGGDWTAQTGPTGFRFGAGSLEAEFTGIALSPLDGLSPVETTVEGEAAGTVRANVSQDGSLEGTARVALGPGTLQTNINGEVARFTFDDSDFEFNADSEGITATLGLEAEQEDSAAPISLQAEAAVPGFTNLNQELDSQFVEGSLQASVPDLALLEAFLPQLANTIGSASMELALGGTVGEAELEGEIQITGGETDLPELGIELRGVEVAGGARAIYSEDGSFAGTGRVVLGPGTLQTVVDDEPSRFAFGGSGVEVTANPDGLTATVGFEVEHEDLTALVSLEADASIPGYTNLNQDFASQDIEGSVRASMADLTLVDALLPELTNTTGSASMDLVLGGTVGEPAAEGEILVTGAETDVPELGIRLQGVEISARIEEDGELLVDGRVTSGAGTVRIEVRPPTTRSMDDPTVISITGERFTVANRGDAQIHVSPDLELRITRGLVDLTGNLFVPAANIEIIEVPENAVGVSSDVVIVGDTIAPSPPLRTQSDVTVTLGDTVFFRGFGLSTQLAGNIRLRDSPGAETRATGEIQMQNGRYTEFGQNLQIEPGRMVFNGTLTDPGLDARAFRRTADGTEAGLRVRGTLQAPEVEVYSDPAQSESNALSYLLLGQPMSEASATDQRQVTAAAVLGGSVLAATLGQSVGLDEARIETGANANEASLVAGKYLSPQLYVAYGIGLYERTNIFRVRYLLTRNWSVQVETGHNNGTDILYRIERGR